MTDDLKGATRGGESHSTKKPMEGVLGNEWHIHPGGLAWKSFVVIAVIGIIVWV